VSDATLDLMDAVINRLRGFAALKALVGGDTPRIYSAVPQQTPFPFVNVGISSTPFAAADFSGQQHMVRVQAHSQTGSQQEALAIRQQVMAALDRQETDIVLTDSALIKCEFSGLADCFMEPDGKTWQSVIQFTVLTQ
jgi:Protein of unknown function (DUF3168)